MQLEPLEPEHRSLPDLPYELCEYIAQFLSAEDVQRLYFISRAWYAISMASRYKEAGLSIYWTRSREQPCASGQIAASVLGAPILVAKSAKISPSRGKGDLEEFTEEMTYRVRTFELVFTDRVHEVDSQTAMKVKYIEEKEVEKPLAQTLVVRLKQALRRAVSRPFRRKPKLSPPPPVLSRPQEPDTPSVTLDELATFTERLSRVNNLTIGIEGLRDGILEVPRLEFIQSQLKLMIAPFLTSIWSTSFGSNLRSLTISVPIEFWDIVFQPSYRIERLEHLGILFIKALCTSWFIQRKVEGLVKTVLSPFIQQHLKTLRSLDIKSPYFNCAPFFQHIQHLPSLQCVRVEECGCLVRTGSPSEGSFYDFLQQHSKTIAHISWKFCSRNESNFDALGRDIWFDLRYHDPVPLPELRALELRNLTGFSELPTPLISNMDRLLRSHRSTLTKLCLQGYDPYLDTFYDLLDNISSRTLVHFEIGTRALPRDLLATMATKLPSLRFLRLSYHDVGRQTLVRIIQLGSASIISYPILDFLMSGEDKRVLGSECPLHKIYKYHFLQDMREFSLSNWPLEELHLETTNKFRADWETDALEVGRAVLRSLPRVMSFNGLHRDQSLGLQD